MKRNYRFIHIVLLILIAVGAALVIWRDYPEDSDVGKDIYVLKTLFDSKLITHVDTGEEKLAALTFDDGPDPRFTPQVLDILKEYKVPATFFVIGLECEAHPELIVREVREGHEVENHTYTHPDLQKDSGLRIDEEIVKDQIVIERLTHRRPHFFRPPKRLFNQEVVDLAEVNGYQTILWTICVEHHAAKTIPAKADRVVGRAEPGIIILAHDGRLNRTATVEALPLIIQAYQSMGYRFVTLDELMRHKVN